MGGRGMDGFDPIACSSRRPEIPTHQQTFRYHDTRPGGGQAGRRAGGRTADGGRRARGGRVGSGRGRAETKAKASGTTGHGREGNKRAGMGFILILFDFHLFCPRWRSLRARAPVPLTRTVSFPAFTGSPLKSQLCSSLVVLVLLCLCNVVFY